MSEATIGELIEVRGGLAFEWKIKIFPSFLQESNVLYESPNFYFSGESWCIQIRTNALRKKYDVHNSVNLVKRSSGSPGYIRFFPSHPDVELSPSDEFTMQCSLKSCEPNTISESLFHRLELVSRNLKDIYENGKRTDITLKFSDGNIPAHRMILEKRSSVFEAMFNPDTKEDLTREVEIPDLDKHTVDTILGYLYYGDIGELGKENVVSVYKAADKYNIKDVKDTCVKFILRNLSGEWLYDIIIFINTYHHEEEIRSRALEYFTNHARDIVGSHKWKSFVKENSELVLNFLG